MHATPVPPVAAILAIDLAKDVFELGFADAHGRVIQRQRLRRDAFAPRLDNHAPLRMVMEACEQAMAGIEGDLREFNQRDTRAQRYQQAAGVGLITATALSASVGALDRFPSGRHLASALGLTPREHSSGSIRRLGRVTKRGDVYLRTLLIHGASPHFSPPSVARAPRRRRGALRGGRDGDGVVDTTLSRIDRAQRATASVSASAVGGW